MPLYTRIGANVHAEFSQNTAGGVETVKPDHSPVFILTDGTASVDEADRVYTAVRTLAASASEDLDFTTVLDLFGNVFNPAEVVAIYIEAAAGNTNGVVVGNATTNAFVGPWGATGTVTVMPGEFSLNTYQKGWAVSPTAKVLHVANAGAGTPVTYTVVVVGRSVAV